MRALLWAEEKSHAMTESALVQEVSSAASGDRDAYAKVVAQCQSVVCSIALAMLRDVAASEDVAQEVFLAAWAGLPKLRSKSSFLAWLRQLTRNQCREYLRRQRRYLPLSEASEPMDQAPSLVERALEQEQELILRSALNEIPPDAREIITLYYREEGSVERCALLLGLTDSAAKKRLSRARERLRETVEVRFAAAAKASAPGAALGALVIAQIGLCPAAQAAGLAASITKSAAPLHAAAVLFKGIGVGVSGSLLLMAFVLRSLLKKAIDDDERRALKRFGAVQSATMIASGVALVVPWPGVPQWLHFTLAWGTEMAFLALSTLLWLPRILARRLAVEKARDPEGFRRRQRRERIYGLLGIVLGLLAGAIGIYLGVKGHRRP